MVSFLRAFVRIRLSEVALSFLDHVHLTMGASLLYSQTCCLNKISSRDERNRAKKYPMIIAREENFETSIPVNTLHDASKSTNQITPHLSVSRKPKHVS